MQHIPSRSSLVPAGTLLPSVFKTLVGELHDYLTGLFGNDGTAATARGTLGISTPAVDNLFRNGSFAVNQRGTLPTTDNAFGIDGWRLLLGAANAAVWTRDTADVPTGAGYASVLTVGSGNNNKFGILQMWPNEDVLKLRGQAISVRVPLKATAGLTNGTGKIRIGIVQFTGTANAVTGDPISAWGAEGTNPTLAASWAFANTPAALSVTTSWADYTVENVSISASATNVGVFIWSDDTTNTQNTDVLRIGGYLTATLGAKAPLAQVDDYLSELLRCKRFLPAYNAPDGNNQWVANGQGGSATVGVVNYALDVEPLILPTGVSYSSLAHFHHQTGAGGTEVLTGLSFLRADGRTVRLSTTTAGNLGAGMVNDLLSVSASAQLLFVGGEI